MKLCFRHKCTLFQSLNAEAPCQHIKRLRLEREEGENIKIQSVFIINNKHKRAEMREHYKISEV